MSIEMDLDNDDTSELSSVDSEVPAAAKTTTRRTSGRTRIAIKAGNKASTSAAASKGKQSRRKKAADESADIAVPSLDEDGNLQEQPNEEIDGLEEDEDEESESEEDDEERDADFRGANSRSSTAGGSRRGRGGRGKAGGGRATTSRGGEGAGRGRPRKQPAGGDEGENDNPDQAEGAGEVNRGKDDFSVEADNNLFNAVKDPRAALEATAEDWLENYRSDEDTRGQALADLVNFVLRCCGCNLSVDMHEAQDLDGVISKLDDIQTDFAKVNQATYPLISKSKGYKKFRSSLQEFLSKLVEATSSSEVLYDDIFCETFQSWLVALSSSKLRAFRHTSTVITMSFVEALCEVSLGNKEAFSQLQRQKEAEVKRSAKIAGKKTRAGATDKTRLQELEAFIKNEHSKKMRLENYFKEIFDAVFIHRYRDAEPAIRMECIKSLGVWMSTLPDHFLEGNYLRYIGWMLTDLDKTVRREAVMSLSALYDKDDYIGSMQHFTERFKARLVEMATSDSELNIRVEATGVLRQIDRHGLLDEEQRDEVARLIFDAEPRVRRAAAIFFDSILKENLDEKKADHAASGRRGNDVEHGAEKFENMLEWKCLAAMLVKFNTQLDTEIANQLQALEIVEPEEDEEDVEDVETAESAFTRYQKDRKRADAKLRKGNGAASTAQLTAILQGQNKDRMSLAVETLYFEVDIVRNWSSLLDYLLLDHSTAQKTNATAGNEARAEAAPIQNQVHALCRLEDAEETVLLSVFVSAVKTTRDRARMLSSVNEDDRDEIYRSTTRAIMNAISRLFAKHQTDATRCTTLLLLPQQMNLDLYLEMRQVTSYEQLWDDITRQFVSHSDIYLLERAMEAIGTLRQTQALSATNADKSSALEAAVVEPLRQLIDGIDANNATPLDEDSIKKFTAWLTRLCLMLKNWDVTPSLTEAAPGNAPTVLEAINQLVERGQMGFQEEEKVIQQSLDILYLCYLWRITKIAPNESTPDSLIEERNTLVQQCQDYAIGELNSASDAVKRTAFRLLLDLQIAAKARHSISEDANDVLTLSVQTQYRCAGFVQAEIERYASLFDPKGSTGDDLVDENEDEEGNDSVDVEEGSLTAFRPVTLAQHAATYAFNDLMVSYARAICVDVLDLHHASTMLIHYDRFGPFFNECCRWLGDAVRQFGVLGDAGHAAAGVAIESLKGALELYLAATVKSDSCFTSLARHLSNHLVLRGKGFAIAARLPSEDLVRLHKDLITYTVKKYKRLADQEKHASKNKALVMFKGLVPCLLGMTGKEAAVVHLHMNEALKEAGVEVADTSKHWDAQRTYDKRLVTLMSKDAGIKVTARKAVKTRKETVNGNNTGEESEEEENDGSQLPGRGRPKVKPSAGAAQAKKVKAAPKKAVRESRPQALPTRRSDRAAGRGNTSKYAEDSSDVDNDEEKERQQEKAAPRAAANGTQGKSKRLTPSDGESDEEVTEALKASGTTLPARRGTASAGTKRTAAEVLEDVDDDAPLPPPLASRLNTAASSTGTLPLPTDDLTTTPASSVRSASASPEPVMSLSTQELRETDSFEFDLPDSPPNPDNQSDAADDLPRRKRSRY